MLSFFLMLSFMTFDRQHEDFSIACCKSVGFFAKYNLLDTSFLDVFFFPEETVQNSHFHGD